MDDLKQVLEKDIYKIVQELKKCTNKKRYFKLVSSCDDLTNIAHLKDIDIRIPKELEYELSKINIDEIDDEYTDLIFENVNTMYSYNKKLCKMLDKLDINSYYIKEHQNQINFEESLSLSNKFFEKYDSSIYEYFKNMINSANFFVMNQTNDYLGVTYRSNDLIRPYIHISKENNITDFLSIIHEIIHAYIFEMQRYISPKEQYQDVINNLQEVYPMFIELVGIKYLNDIRFNKEEIICLKENNDHFLIQNLLNYEDDIYGEFNHDLFVKDEAYAYGSVLSYFFYKEYRKNEEKTKDNILRFMLESKEHDKFYMLDNYGLNKNDIINSQKLKKHMKIHRKDLELL